jgi:predicted Zn-dependent peptidase
VNSRTVISPPSLTQITHLAKVSTLPNGLQVASCSMPFSQTVAVGLWCAVGARFESSRLNGISHFVEHLLFKGTKKRSSRQISEEIEGIGGDLNAFTDEERTCYYAAASSDHFPRVAGVLADMYQNSRFDRVEIERERGVIVEEIEMVRDEPAQYVHELLNEQTWKGHPLARAITGTKKSLASITRNDLLDHMRSHYHAGRTIFTAAGAVDHDEVVKLASKFLGRLPSQPKGNSPRSLIVPKPQTAPRVLIAPRESQQSQIALSFRGVGVRDSRRHIASLLNIILGGNMSSRLFQELRERRGLCYSVSSSLSTYADCGSFDISLGLDEGNVTKAMKLILKECRRIAEKGVSVAELRRACDYSIGTSRMALERAATQNYRLGTLLLTLGRIIPPEEVYATLAKVTPSEIQNLAQEIFRSETISLAMIGQGPSREEFLSLIRSA